MVNPKCLVDSLYRDDEEIGSEHEDPWCWWNTFRTTADFSNKLSIALELSADIPSKLEVARWQGKQQTIIWPRDR